MIHNGSVYNTKLATILESPEKYQEPVEVVPVRNISVSTTSTMVNPEPETLFTQTNSKVLSVRFVDPFEDPVNPFLDPVENPFFWILLRARLASALIPLTSTPIFSANVLPKSKLSVPQIALTSSALTPCAPSTILHWLLGSDRCILRLGKRRLPSDSSLEASTPRQEAEDW